jgi:hypothetical protein
MRHLVLLPALVLGVAACQPSPEQQLKGTWTVSDVKLPASMQKNPAATMVTNALKGGSLQVKEDKKYSMTFQGQSIEGDWTLAGRAATFQPKTIAGKSIEDTKKQLKAMGMGSAADNVGNSMALSLSEDGKTLQGKTNDVELSFKKSES